jgi:hypothetical protein
MSTEIESLKMDFTIKCEEVDELVTQLDTVENLIEFKSIKLKEMKVCMELQKDELENMYD